jgi:hypothetical protein
MVEILLQRRFVATDRSLHCGLSLEVIEGVVHTPSWRGSLLLARLRSDDSFAYPGPALLTVRSPLLLVMYGELDY